MPSNPPAQARDAFERRWETLGLGALAEQLGTAETITPNTLVAASRPVLAASDPRAVTRAPLPRLSLGLRPDVTQKLAHRATASTTEDGADIEIAGVLG